MLITNTHRKWGTFLAFKYYICLILLLCLLNFPSFAQVSRIVTTLSFSSYPNDTAINYFNSKRSVYSYNSVDSLLELKKYNIVPNISETEVERNTKFYNSSGFLIYELNITNDTLYYIYRDNLNRDTLKIYSNSDKLSKYYNSLDTIPYESIFSKFDTISGIYSPVQKYTFSYDSLFRIDADTLFQYIALTGNWDALYYFKYFYNNSGKLVAKKKYFDLNNGTFSTIPSECDTFIYNSNTQLSIWKTDNCSGNSSSWLYRNFYYDSSGNLVHEQHLQSGYINCNSYTSLDKKREYDASGRLQKEVILQVSYSIPCNLNAYKTEYYSFYGAAGNIAVDLFIPPKYKTSCSNLLRPVYAISINTLGQVHYQWNHSQLAGINCSGVKLSLNSPFELTVNITDSLLNHATNSIELFNHGPSDITLETSNGVSASIFKCYNEPVVIKIDSLQLYNHSWYQNGIIIQGTMWDNSISVTTPGNILCNSFYSDNSGCSNIASVNLIDDIPFAEIMSDPVNNGQPYDEPRIILRNNLHQDNYLYEWYHNGVIIPGISDSFLVASLPGKYYFEAISPNGCKTASDELEIKREVFTGEIDGIYYSNPVSEGNLTIYLDPLIIDLQNDMLLEIFNYSGQLVRKLKLAEQATTIPLSGFAHGLYVLSLSQMNKQVHVGKLIY